MDVPRLDRLFQALADQTRLRILNLLDDGELCVCYLVEVLDAPQPKISRHLAWLRRAGLVATRRDGKWIHYRLNEPPDPETRAVVAATMDVLRRDEAMARDRNALDLACCGVRTSELLMRAPKPARTDD